MSRIHIAIAKSENISASNDGESAPIYTPPPAKQKNITSATESETIAGNSSATRKLTASKEATSTASAVPKRTVESEVMSALSVTNESTVTAAASGKHSSSALAILSSPETRKDSVTAAKVLTNVLATGKNIQTKTVSVPVTVQTHPRKSSETSTNSPKATKDTGTSAPGKSTASAERSIEVTTKDVCLASESIATAAPNRPSTSKGSSAAGSPTKKPIQRNIVKILNSLEPEVIHDGTLAVGKDASTASHDSPLLEEKITANTLLTLTAAQIASTAEREVSPKATSLDDSEDTEAYSGMDVERKTDCVPNTDVKKI